MQERLQNINVVSSELLPTPEGDQARPAAGGRARKTSSIAAGKPCAGSSTATTRGCSSSSGRARSTILDAAREYAQRLSAARGPRRQDDAAHHARLFRKAAHDGRAGRDSSTIPTWTTRSRSKRASASRASCCCTSPNIGVPAATEALDPIMPQYLSELISWTAIGARTTESQTHREMASGLSMPVGFKNGTDGSLTVAINALQSVRHPHHFLGITQQGQSAVFRTRGNKYGHIVLRGGGSRTNYDSVSLALCERELDEGEPAGEHRGRLQSRQFEQGSRACSRWSPKTWRTRSSRAIGRSWASCSRATCTGAASRSRRIAAN